MMSVSPIDWPWQYSFPPFFTIQPNKETRKNQLQAWKSLVLDYHRCSKLYVLGVADAERCPLFFNTSISRKLNSEGILTVLEVLQKSGNAEPANQERTRWFIYWKTLAEWGTLIYTWAQDSGLSNSVCTFYEIVNTPNVEFTGIDQAVLLKSMKMLESENKAEVINLDGNFGVKFF